MKLSLDWVAESEQNEDGNLSTHIDNYTNTDIYEYIVELDADGKVIGGEWIQGSRTDHPDFLWAAIEMKYQVAVPVPLWMKALLLPPVSLSKLELPLTLNLVKRLKLQ